MKKCSNCGKEILDKAVCCPYCGETQKREDSIENIKKIKYCVGCGEKLKEEYDFCPVCGRPVQRALINPNGKHDDVKPIPPGATKDAFGDNIPNAPGNTSGKNPTDLEKKPQGLLKIFGIVFGIMYGYFAMTYLPYLSYYMAADKAWGFFMVVACTWSCVVLFLIALKCQKQYGIQLAYMVFAGAILKSILHLIKIQRTASYQYSERSFSDYLPIAGALLLAFACYYLMKQEDMLDASENTGFVENVKRIPEVFCALISRDGSIKTGKNKVRKPQKDPVKPGSEAEKIIFVVNNLVFLIFGILYTVNLVYNMIYSFSLFKLVTCLFTILTCIAIWLIYSNSRKGSLDVTGFALIYGINIFRMIIRIIISVFMVIVAISANSVWATFLVIVFAVFDLLYWYSLNKTFSGMRAIAKGYVAKVRAGIYPIVILCINSVIKLGMLGWASFLQTTANGITSTLNQYGNETSSLFGELSYYLGLGYGFGYGQSSSIIQSFLNPIIEWVQSTLGYSQSVIIMVIAVVIPILEIILLVKIRSYMDA